MSVPTVPGSDIDFHTPQRGVHLNAGALNQRLQGDRAIANAVGDVGEAAARIDQDIQRALRVRIASDVDLKMRAARQSFIETLRNDQDEAAWEDRAKEVTDGVRDELFADEKRVPPGMRAEVDTAFQGWRQSLLTETKGLARVQAVNRAWGKVKEDFDEKLADGDAAAAMTNLRTARDLGLAGAEEIDKLERGIPRQIAENFINNGLRTNPKGTMELLRSGASIPAVDAEGRSIVAKSVIPAGRLQELEQEARILTNAWESDNYDRMLTESANPVTGMIPEDEIRRRMDAGEIDIRAGRALIQSQDSALKTQEATAARELAALDRDRYDMLLAMNDDTTGWGSPDYAKDLIEAASSISSPILRLKAVNEVRKQQEVVKKTGDTALTPVQREIFDRLSEDRDKNGFFIPPASDKTDTPRSLSEFQKDTVEDADKRVAKLYGKGKTFAGIAQEEQLNFARVQTKMREWFKANPTANEEQAETYRQSLVRPFVLSNAARAIGTPQRPDPQGEQARKWLEANPDDPRAPAVRARLSGL